jgi:hypothetical protein
MILEAYNTAIESMHWLTDSDAAAVELGRQYAQRIDEALEFGEGQEVTKALYLGPHLLNTLREIGGTPPGRAALNTEREVKGKLALLREKHGA